MKKNQLLPLIICIVMLCGNGCTERNLESRISNNAVVFTVGIEKVDDTYNAYAQIINFIGKKGKKGYDYDIVQVTAPNLYELVDHLNVLNQMPSLWTHLQVLIFHESINYQELKLFSQFFARSEDFPIKFAVVHSKDNVKQVMQIPNDTFVIPTMSIYNILFGENPNLGIIPVHFFEMVTAIHEPRQDVHLPILTIENEVIQLGGTAIYKKDDTFEELSAFETKCLMRVKKKLNKIMQSFTSSDDSGTELTFSTVLEKSKVKMKVTLEENEPVIQINIRDTYHLEILSPQVKLDEHAIKKLNMIYQKQLQHDIEAAIKKLQQMSANIIGFAQLIEQQQPAYWKKHQQAWSSIYPILPVRVTVDSALTNTGMILN